MSMVTNQAATKGTTAENSSHIVGDLFSANGDDFAQRLSNNEVAEEVKVDEASVACTR